MSGAGPQLAPRPEGFALPKGRTALSHLLHALNQPLTGLQCSLELATAGPRPTDHYVRTLREGLDLVSRMRVLVDAIRELSEAYSPSPDDHHDFRLETLLYDAAAELQPVAEAKGVRIRVVAHSPLPVCADRTRLAALFFRVLDSAVGLTREATELKIEAEPERGSARVALTWSRGDSPDHSPFSRPELGLLVAQAQWEQARGSWTETRSGDHQTCTLQLSLASRKRHSSAAVTGGQQ